MDVLSEIYLKTPRNDKIFSPAEESPNIRRWIGCRYILSVDGFIRFGSCVVIEDKIQQHALFCSAISTSYSYTQWRKAAVFTRHQHEHEHNQQHRIRSINPIVLNSSRPYPNWKRLLLYGPMSYFNHTESINQSINNVSNCNSRISNFEWMRINTGEVESLCWWWQCHKGSCEEGTEVRHCRFLWGLCEFQVNLA